MAVFAHSPNGARRETGDAGDFLGPFQGIEAVNGGLPRLFISGGRVFERLRRPVMGAPAHIIVAHLAHPAVGPRAGFQFVGEDHPLLPPLLQMPLVIIRLLLEREGLVINDAKTLVCGKTHEIGSTGNRVHMVVGQPSAPAKILEGAVLLPDGALGRGHPVVIVKARRKPEAFLPGQSVRRKDGSGGGAAQHTQAVVGGHNQLVSKGKRVPKVFGRKGAEFNSSALVGDKLFSVKQENAVAAHAVDSFRMHRQRHD